MTRGLASEEARRRLRVSGPNEIARGEAPSPWRLLVLQVCGPLTGESLPVEKAVEPTPEDAPLAQRTDRVFLGTSITAGTGQAVVMATGMATELGKIAHLLGSVEQSEAPLQKRLARVGRTLLLLCAVICTDKTGTLTTGTMTVREVWGGDHARVLDAAAACCDAELDRTATGGVGDPTEIALSLRRADGILYVKGAVDLLVAIGLVPVTLIELYKLARRLVPRDRQPRSLRAAANPLPGGPP